MFTSERAVNSGQLSSRFMLAFSLGSLSLTNTASPLSPSFGSHRCWQWWLWNEFRLCEEFQPRFEPLSLAADDNALSVLPVYISISPPSPKSLLRLFSSFFLSQPCVSLVLPFLSLPALFFAPDCGKALSCDVASFLGGPNTSCGHPNLFLMICCLFCLSVLKKKNANIHLILCFGDIMCAYSHVFHVTHHPLNHDERLKCSVGLFLCIKLVELENPAVS